MALSPMKVIEINTTNQAIVLEIIKETHHVQTGMVCNSPHDIVCIDSVCNEPSRNKYWTIEVNGDYNHVNSQSVVRPQDKLVLKYASLNE